MHTTSPLHAVTWLLWALAAAACVQLAPSPVYVALVTAIAFLVVSVHRLDGTLARAFPILVTLGPGGRTSEFPAHDGEEFGYVLEGEILMNAGRARYPVSSGESFCLHPDAPHFIENTGDREARFLLASTPPTF